MSTHRKTSQQTGRDGTGSSTRTQTSAARLHELLEEKQASARQAPNWPGAGDSDAPREGAQAQAPIPGQPQTDRPTPSRVGYERDEVGKRHK